MTSTVSAEAPGAGLQAVLHALFPCGSITGAPKVAAMRRIRQMETAPRGLYCGSVGWLAPNGDFSLNVAIRTLVLDAHGHGVYSVGGGIVRFPAASVSSVIDEDQPEVLRRRLERTSERRSTDEVDRIEEAAEHDHRRAGATVVLEVHRLAVDRIGREGHRQDGRRRVDQVSTHTQGTHR